MPLAEIPSMVQEEASRPQFTPTGSNTSPQEAMQCDHGMLDKRGEFIRYIRICSSCSFYRLCCQRLIRALLFLNYPKHVIQAQAIDWDDRHKYTTLRRDSAASGGGRDAVDSHIVSLSQAEQNPHSTIGPIVHVLRVVHHSALPLRWSSVVHGLKSKLPFIPGLKLFAILQLVQALGLARAPAAHWVMTRVPSPVAICFGAIC